MKKNGFIATSLIYSFFLIFITLFLTIIADYLQNKVLLTEIEKGIKDEINSTMGIKDFEVGDMVSFVSDINDPNVTNQWVIANVNTITKKIILYSYDFTGSLPSGFSVESKILEETDFNIDIEFAYRNNTYFNKIIYTFSTNSGAIKEYSVGTSRIVSIECTTPETSEYNFGSNCIKGGTLSNNRKRIVVSIGDNRYSSKTDDMGIILLEVV